MATYSNKLTGKNVDLVRVYRDYSLGFLTEWVEYQPTHGKKLRMQSETFFHTFKKS